MAGLLFQGSFIGRWQNVLRSAANDVKNLGREILSDPSLGGQLQKIAEKYSFDVARINKDEITATAREEEIRRHDYGRDHLAKRTMLDVSIPFSGDPESFQAAPSSCAVIMHRVEVGHDSLTLTIPDDQNAQREVDTAVSQLNQNLDTLRAEYERAKPQLEQTIQQAAQARKSQIASEAERDKGRTFKINR